MRYPRVVKYDQKGIKNPVDQLSSMEAFWEASDEEGYKKLEEVVKMDARQEKIRQIGVYTDLLTKQRNKLQQENHMLTQRLRMYIDMANDIEALIEKKCMKEALEVADFKSSCDVERLKPFLDFSIKLKKC